MCGIAGVVGRVAPDDRARVVAARDAMEHRGPDAAGLWEGPAAILAARRLAIIDLSAAGTQPMTSADGRRVLVFNGEIYNFRELRRQLESAARFRTNTDTEVVIHGYRRWGLKGFLDRAEGMFAFALWDAERRRLVAARDRAGEKPFFYEVSGGTLRFASVLNALRTILPRRVEVDLHALDAFLAYQAVPSPMAIFKGTCQLPPAHALTFEAGTGTCRVERYWRLSFTKKVRAEPDDVVGEVATRVRNAVRRRLVADVPVGVFLSGGVDSSIVAAMAAQEGSPSIEAVNLGFDDPDVDERRYARAVAATVGMRLHEEVLRPQLVAELPGIVWHYGQPIADVSIVPNHYLAAAAAGHMRVILNGDGGDELFGGYRRPMVEWAVGPWRRHATEGVRRSVGRAFEGWPASRFRRLAALARAGSMPAADAFTYDRAFRIERTRAYAETLRTAVLDWHPDALYRDVWDSVHAVEDVDRALAGDFETYLPDQLLAKADRASMAHSLEARAPFLDTALMEYAARIPSRIRLRHARTKYILKRVAADLVPRHVAYRRKRGFVMPASTWLRGELAPYVRAALDNATFFERGWIRPEFVRMMLEDHFARSRDWSEQIFTLLVLEVWSRIFLDGTLGRDARMDAFLSGPQRAPRTRLRTLQVGMEWFAERPGGLNRVYAELVRHLPGAGVGVHGLVAGTAEVATESEGRVEGFVPHLQGLTTRLAALYRRGRAIVRGDRDRLVVAHFALYAYPLLGALGRRPLVVHFQGPWGLEGGAERQRWMTVWLKTLVERAVYRRATAFIVLSTPFARILTERFGVPAERIHVIPGGVDVARFDVTAPRAEARARLGWPGDRKVVVAVRRLMRRMGLDNLVAAVEPLRKTVPDVLVLVAGRGPIGPELQQEIDRRGLGDHVQLLGFVPDDLLPLAYRAADVSIVPSVTLEGFGLIVAESLAAGTPCLVTPVGGLPEAVGGLSPQLILPGHDPVDLAEGLAGALRGTLSLPTAEECVAFARRNYDWPVIAERVRDVYESVLR